jgi:hypothetical protein
VGAHRLCFIPPPFTAHHVLGNSHACLCRLRDSYYQGQCGHDKKSFLFVVVSNDVPSFAGIYLGPGGKKHLRGFVAPIRNKKIYSWFKIFQQEAFCDFHQDIGIIFKL